MHYKNQYNYQKFMDHMKHFKIHNLVKEYCNLITIKITIGSNIYHNIIGNN